MKTDVIPSSTRLIFPSTAPNLVRGLFAAALGAFALCATAQGVDVIKGNNTTALNDNASWTTSVPTSSDVAVWNNTVTLANTSSMGANLSFGGIKVTGTLGGAIGVSGVNTGNVTANSTTDTFTYSGSTVSNGNVVTFGGTPTGLTAGRAYYVINATATTYQISETLNGSFVNFTSNVTMTNNVQWILTLGASGIVVDGSRSLSSFSNAVSMSANQTWSVASGKTIDSNNNTNNSGIVVFNNGNTLTVDGAGTVDLGAFYGAGGITKNGTGTLSMWSTDNTFTGNVVLNDGTLNAGSSATTLGSGASTLTLNGGTLTAKSNAARDFGRNTTIAGNATFYINNSANNGGQAYTLGTLSIGANTFTVTHNAAGVAGSLTFGATTLTGNATFDVSTRTDNSLILGAVGESGGARGFTKNGVGTLTLNGTNTYTGLTTVSAGALNIGSGGSLASGNALALGASGTATFANAGQALGAVSNANTASNALNFSASIGTITLASLSGEGNTRFGSNGTVTGGISNGTVTSVGFLTADISGGTIAAGGLLTGNITSGTVGAGSLSASIVSGGTSNITGAANITSLSGGTTTVGGVATIGTMTSGTANINGATTAITTLNGGSILLGNSTVLAVSNGTTSGIISGGGSFTKVTSGTLTLTGANTYTGTTNVTGGTLLANNTSGSATGSGNVTVASGATLGGIGTIGGASTITGILSPGDGGIGTLNITGGATWQGASSNGAATDWIFQLGADNTADLLHITGNFTKDTSLGTNFRFDFGGSMKPGTFKLVDWTGSSSFSANSTASDFTYTSLGSELTGSFSLHDNQLDFTALPAVPEPSTWVAMAALILTGGTMAMRRRTRQATGIL